MQPLYTVKKFTDDTTAKLHVTKLLTTSIYLPKRYVIYVIAELCNFVVSQMQLYPPKLFWQCIYNAWTRLVKGGGGGGGARQWQALEIYI